MLSVIAVLIIILSLLYSFFIYYHILLVLFIIFIIILVPSVKYLPNNYVIFAVIIYWGYLYMVLIIMPDSINIIALNIIFSELLNFICSSNLIYFLIN